MHPGRSIYKTPSLGTPVQVRAQVHAGFGFEIDCVERSGQDNTSTLCSTGDVPNIFEGDTSDHDGPYDGVTMGC